MTPTQLPTPPATEPVVEPASGPVREKEKKTRSRSGCYTCRRRKKACDHVHPVCGNCLRLEIPCVYQKVTGNKKRKRQPKDGAGQEDDEDPEEGEDGLPDTEAGKGNEGPSYRLLDPGPSTQRNISPPRKHHITAVDPHASNMDPGYQLPLPEAQPFSLEITTLDDFVNSDPNVFQEIPHALEGIDLFPSGAPLLDPSTDLLPPDNALAMFTQYYGMNEETHNHLNPTAMYNASPSWVRGSEIPTPSAPPLDIIFSPLARATPESHGPSTGSSSDQMNGSGFIVDSQDPGERYEEGKPACKQVVASAKSAKVSSATAVRPFSPATAQLVRNFVHSAHVSPERPIGSTTDHLNVGQVTAALPSWLWAHVPTLLDYFINGFAPVISVLGKPERNKLLKTLLPATSTSPILLHALIGWAASHLAVSQPSRDAGKAEPYTSIARITTSIADHTALVKMNSVGMQVAQEENLSLENEMWLLLILGGIEVCCGSIAKWNNRLPYIRNLMWRLERSLPASNIHSMSSVHTSLALNCIYHDITGSLARTSNPGIPLRVYETFIRGSLAEPDVYMGASATVYQVYAEIAMLAAEISALDDKEPSMDTQYQLRDLLLNIHSCAGKIDSLDIHPEIARVVDASQEDALENHHLILAFHMHKLAARLLLRQTCLRCTPCDLESRLLCARLLGAIQPVLHTPSEAQILLPLFLAGVDATAIAQKEQVRQMFKSTRQRTGCENAHAVYGLLKRVWAANVGGRAWVDWRALAEQSEAVISFA